MGYYKNLAISNMEEQFEDDTSYLPDEVANEDIDCQEEVDDWEAWKREEQLYDEAEERRNGQSRN